MLAQIDGKTGGIYLHIPFCARKCPYCDFYSLADRSHQIDRFITQICHEIRLRIPTAPEWVANTLFLGGGTPSILEPAQLSRILEALSESIDLMTIDEFTMEVNPGEISLAKLLEFRALGVNRLSIGFQSLQDENLQRLGRIHQSRHCFEVYEQARAAGYENISVDLIFRIPGQDQLHWERDLAQVIDLDPEHISTYSLTLEPGTPFALDQAAGRLQLPGQELDRTMLLAAYELLDTAGYCSYEISNHAKPGQACRHNLHYWHRRPYVGLGPSAHSFDGHRREWNVADLDQYLGHLDAGQIPVSGSEDISKRTRFNEQIMLGLRNREGVNLNTLPTCNTADAFAEHFRAQLERWSGNVQINGDRLILSEEGRLWADAITVDFMQAED